VSGLPVVIERVRTVRPPTKRQLEVAELISAGASVEDVAEVLGLLRAGVRWHVEQLAALIPGDLPPRLKVIAWYRGAPRYVLENPRVTPGMRLAEALRAPPPAKK
jgi:hypothetical protein